MLAGDFFYIRSMQAEETSVEALLEINPVHKIFEGHFPGHPVVPGVCMLQMVKEILEKALGQSTRLVKADQLKFLAIIDPVKQPTIQAQLKYSFDDEGRIGLSASFFNGGMVHFKMSAHFKVV